jgi:hypothetical protein
MRQFRFAVLVAAFVALISAPVAALAAPLSYYNSPMSSVQDVANAVITSINNSQTGASPLVIASGTTTATANGLRVNVSVTGLSTAASTLSAAMVVTDSAVTAASQVNCLVNNYAGAGVPMIANLIPAAGSFTFNIQNVSTGAALNATVVAACQVFN